MSHRRVSPPKLQWCKVFDSTAGPDTLDRLHHGLAALWSDHPEIPPDVRMNVALAASEICTNIIEHAAAGAPVRMTMECRLLPGLVEVRFTDDGNPAPVDLDSVAMPDELADRGRGLAIAKAVLDGLTYSRDATGNHWVLTHRLCPA